MIIEVFVRKEEVVFQPTQLGRPIADHYCTAHDTFKTEKILTEDSKKVLDEATEKAKELNVKMVIYDLSTLKSKLAASRKRIFTPAWRITK